MLNVLELVDNCVCLSFGAEQVVHSGVFRVFFSVAARQLNNELKLNIKLCKAEGSRSSLRVTPLTLHTVISYIAFIKKY